MAELVPVSIDYTGGEITFSPAEAAGDSFDNTSGRVLVIFKNEDASEHTVTVASQEPCSQGEIHNVTIALAADSETAAGTFYRSRFNDEADQVQLTYDGVTSVSVAALDIS